MQTKIKVQRPDREAFTKAWFDPDLTRLDVALKFGISKTLSRRIAIEFGLPLERDNNYMDTRRTDDPTPEEIEQRAAEVRKTWTAAVQEQRLFRRATPRKN